MTTIGPRASIPTSSQLEDLRVERSRPSLLVGLVGSVVVMNVLSTVLSLMV
jgi:hypothetical protein